MQLKKSLNLKPKEDKFLGMILGTNHLVSQPAFTCSKLTLETLEQGVM